MNMCMCATTIYPLHIHIHIHHYNIIIYTLHTFIRSGYIVAAPDVNTKPQFINFASADHFRYVYPLLVFYISLF